MDQIKSFKIISGLVLFIFVMAFSQYSRSLGIIREISDAIIYLVAYAWVISAPRQERVQNPKLALFIDALLLLAAAHSVITLLISYYGK